MKKISLLIVIGLILLTSCTPPVVIQIDYATATPTATAAAQGNPPVGGGALGVTATPGAAAQNGPTGESGGKKTVTPAAPSIPGTSGLPVGKVPNFDHIVLILLENHGFSDVIGNTQMPNLNAWAKQYALLAQYHAIRHPSLPNYIALMSGDTYGITKDCNDCFIDQPNIADRIEAGGKTWRDYQEDMPGPCFLGNSKDYVQKHNPFLYFDNIRLNTSRCDEHVVPLTQLDTDLAANKLPNFSFIMPNMCNSGHDCSMDVTDQWLGQMVNKLQSSPALGKNSLIIIAFDEAEGQNDTCCGLPKRAGGQVPVVLISPLVKPGFQDLTPYSHYSLLKTILEAWNLPDLGNTSMQGTLPITDAWK